MKNTIVVDLDGTLCDCSHRVHLAQAKQWEEFHKGIPEDKVYEDVHQIMSALLGYYDIILLTSRDEKTRQATMDWFEANKILDFVDELLMRPEGNHESDHILKPRLLMEYFGSLERAKEKVLFILEDRDKVVQIWRDLGFRCWQVQAGAY